MTKDSLAKGLAIAGIVLVWFPFAAMLLITLIALIAGHGFHMDYLMPAELSPVALLGAGLLLWAAIRARSRRGLIAWGLAAALACLVGSQGLAMATGLASGATPTTSFWFAVVIVILALYMVALIVIGVAGILLLRELNRRGKQA